MKATAFGSKKCNFNSVPKKKQLQAIHAVITINDVFVKPASGFCKSVYYIVPLMFVFFFRSEFDFNNCKFVTPLKALTEDQMDDLQKYGILCLKIYGELPTEELHAWRWHRAILTCSPKSIFEECVLEQLLKLQRKKSCMHGYWRVWVTVKLLLHIETFCWNLCATALQVMFQKALHPVTWSVFLNII